jgi:hypothetical protein
MEHSRNFETPHIEQESQLKERTRTPNKETHKNHQREKRKKGTMM